ncbi:hypothetical protein ACI01nite_25120 [Acetobacter cibinongensis]|uniref:HEPN domain-containing protein n=1 Tax=Acetobacter cibinongensis TaxID=146475 RepID=A0A0D6N7B9_9PROT|nr:HEPN domain-containing protein [Acetobacter cibinongensis]GAN61595.1 hypothetical protein Abci_046_028 [Acetobacter cibinongensis]GBQ17646.1 hypothetical protein AA0482_1969 [Acetobacter cibinongensis NRIC 0482]GEL59910.1 hypothetical protein ACI01nite_25120 [Acetobacter cibinongensis]
MSLNMKKFETDLEILVDEGEDLRKALFFKAYGKEKTIEIFEIPDDRTAKFFHDLPWFDVAYESWYSEALAVVKQLLPDRFQDFKSHFEIPQGRKSLSFTSYRISDALKGAIIKNGLGEIVVDSKAAVPHFRQQIAILVAAKRRFKSSLFEIKQIVQADLFDSELDAARELLKNKFFRAAGAITGVVLEKHLRQVCEDHKIKIVKKHPGISDLNNLLKENAIIEVPQWRHITLLGDYRNLCDHNKQKEPTAEQVTDLIDGTDKVLKTIA